MKKIAIIKLGAKGDVIRTLPISKAIKSQHKDSLIYWITKDNIIDLLKGSPFINNLFPIPYEAKEEFDSLYNFDIDEEATELARKIKAKKKYGFYKENSFVSAFNLGAEYYLNTLFDDEVKKTNKKTYQEMMFEAADIPYNKEHVSIILDNEDLKYARGFIKNNNIKTEKLIGIHIGASPRWPSKVWHEENLKEFIKKAKAKGYEILLFGGPDEIDRHNNILTELRDNNTFVHVNNPNNTDRQFTALVNICKAMICSDSFALHVSLALKKPTIGLFFCSSPDEIEDYGLLQKIVSPMLYDFFPEKMNEHNEELTKSIKAEEVLLALNELTNRNK